MIILSPTRELAIQVADEIRALAKYMHGVKVLPVYGGQEISKQIRSLKGGAQIIMVHREESWITFAEERSVVIMSTKLS